MQSPSIHTFAVALAWIALTAPHIHAQTCVAAPNVEKVRFHQQPDHTSPAATSLGLSNKDIPLTRTGAAKTHGSGISAEDWFEVRQGTSTAWVPAAQVVCRFTPEEAEKALTQRAREALAALKLRNYARLAQLTHPARGIRFSPYGFVDTSVNPVLTRKQISLLASDPRRRTWGNDDGTGEPIRLTFAQYFRKFIWDRDYTRPTKVTYNSAARPGATTLARLWEVFPNAALVNAYFPGKDPEGGAMDWSGLWLVFERIGDAWYLTGIVHDAWTV